MSRVIFVLVAVALCVTLTKQQDCKKLGSPHIHKCCKLMPSANDFRPENMKECMSERKPPPNCDFDICLAKKNGVAATEDGKFDKKSMETVINNQFESKPEIAEEIKNTCIDGDLSDYGPPDFCDLAKFRHCLQRVLISSCSEWDTADAKCVETKELVEKCKKN